MTELQHDLHQDDVDKLNSFLRGEISAVETYDQAIAKSENDASRNILRKNRSSHAERADLLRIAVRNLGGTPSDSSGAWGSFAKAVEGGAKIFGESVAVAALEEGEDIGLRDYDGELKGLSPAAQSFVKTRLLPAQKTTHDAAKRLKEILG